MLSPEGNSFVIVQCLCLILQRHAGIWLCWKHHLVNNYDYASAIVSLEYDIYRRGGIFRLAIDKRNFPNLKVQQGVSEYLLRTQWNIFALNNSRWFWLTFIRIQIQSPDQMKFGIWPTSVRNPIGRAAGVFGKPRKTAVMSDQLQTLLVSVTKHEFNNYH